MKATKIPLELTSGMEKAILDALFPWTPSASKISTMYAVMIAVGLRTEYEEQDAQFFRRDHASGGNYRCDNCRAYWNEHIAPGSKCPTPSTENKE